MQITSCLCHTKAKALIAPPKVCQTSGGIGISFEHERASNLQLEK